MNNFGDVLVSMLVVGSVAFDDIETPFGAVKGSVGGSATFISAAASYFVEPIHLVGIVGDDFPIGDLKFLEDRHVDLGGLEIVKGGKTFRWAGRYHRDVNQRDTLSTELNVFETFDPTISPNYRNSRCVCLGNIDPVLQLSVLRQIEKPELVICDTMNYWIEGKNAELKTTLKHVDILIVNDSEARLLSHESNLVKAARLIRNLGPRVVIIKKGEHGALLCTDRTIFSAPAFPLEEIVDPTGAGDSFAGGFAGWLARSGDYSDENLKRAVISGSAMASFCVEKFGLERLQRIESSDIEERIRAFRHLSYFHED